MGVLIVVGDDTIAMSFGGGEVLRLGLARAIRDTEPPSAVRDAVVSHLEDTWRGDLCLDLEPFTDPEARRQVAAAAEAVALDLMEETPQLVPDVDWARMERPWRTWWIGVALRLVRDLVGADLTGRLPERWTATDRLDVGVSLMTTDLRVALSGFRRSPDAEHRARYLEVAASRQALAARVSEELAQRCASEAERLLRLSERA